ncbi:MAG: T9SS C-terminal target domain-containing protein [Candidatus Kapaibacterium sp.]|nr:MAG: T9SS C-terminal target domain-containing protein [Candidatus Kapabacteria bacterium]
MNTLYSGVLCARSPQNIAALDSVPLPVRHTRARLFALRSSFVLLLIALVSLISQGAVAQILDPTMTFMGMNNGFAAEVRDILELPSGQMLVAGNFNNYRGTAVNRIVRLNADGTLDATFTPPAATVINGQINSIGRTSTGQIVIGGAFNNGTQDYVARLNANGTLDGTFTNGGIIDNLVKSIAVDASDRVVAVGDFSFPRNRIIRLTTTGAEDATFSANVTTGLGGGLTAEKVTIDAAGRILAGGDFLTYNGASSPGIVRLLATGVRDAAFAVGTGFTGKVNDIQVSGTNYLVGGDFTNYNAFAINRMTRLQTNGTRDATFNPGSGFNAAVNTITIETATGRIFAGGGFTQYNGQPRNNITRMSATGAIDNSFNPGTGFDLAVIKLIVQTVGADVNKLVAGGRFTTYNTTSLRGRIARFAYASGVATNGRVFSERTQNDGVTTDILEVLLGPASPTAPLDVEEWISTVADGSDFTLGTHYTIAGGPVPGVMTLAIQKVSNKLARIRLTGTATAHANANDVTNLRIVWQNAALLGNNAAGVENLNTDAGTGANINYTIDFRDPATAVYSGPMFTETFANNGTVTGTRTVTLANAMFRTALATGATFTNGGDYTVTGIPAGMGITITKTGANTANFVLTGTASPHTSAQNGNVQITWNTAAFEGIAVGSIMGINGVNTTTTFLDPATAAYSGTVFPEAVPPNTGTITQTRTVTLTNDNWLNSIANGTVLTGGGVHYTLGGTAVPGSLAFRATKTSNTVVTLDFTGAAGSHANANDVAGITVNFANAVLESNNAAGATGLNPGSLSIDFQDPTPQVTYSGTTFQEDFAADNGSVPTTRTITIANDTWTMPDGLLTAGTHYTVANVPAGLTATLTKAGTVLTAALTGNAAPHTVAANTAAMQFTFLNAAVTSNNAAGVINLNTTPLSVTFGDAITAFTSAAAPNGSTGIAYTHTFAVNGSPASTFAVSSGTLPPGLTLNAATGALTGTPTMAGTFMYTIRATNSVGAPGSFDQAVTTTISAGTAPTMFTSAAPPNGLPATAYTHTFVANGNPAPNSYTVIAGTLPGGLTLNAATGVVSGMPAANGIFNFTVRANNGVGTFDQPFTINVGAGTTMVTSAPPPTGNLTTAYTHTFTGNGSPAANNFTVSAGALPPGLTLNAATGVLSGTPTALGSYNFTIQAGNGFGTATEPYTVQIDPANVAPTMFTSAAPSATASVGTNYTHTFVANGTPAPFYTLASGTLPPGLALNPITGILTGTPTLNGTFGPITVRALNIAGNTVSPPFTITVNSTPPPAPPATTTPETTAPPAPPTAFSLGQSPIPIGSSVGLPYALPVIANGNPAPTYSITGGSLPPGVTLSPSGVLSGTPEQEGTYTFTVQAANNLGAHPATFVMTVGPPRPLITAISQTMGSIGDRVVLTGYNLRNTQNVSIGGVPATSFRIDNDNQITATVGNGNTGLISVRTPNGTASSGDVFTFVPPLIPELLSASPNPVVTGPSNYPLTVQGRNLSPFGTFAVEPVNRPGFRLPVEATSINSTQATLNMPLASRLAGTNRILYTIGNNTVSTTFAVVGAPAPFISNLSVNSTIASAQPFSTVLTGGNYFTNGFASLTVNGQPARGEVFNQNRAVIEIPRNLNIIGSDVRVRLANYDGQFTEATVRVNSLPAPIINTVTPIWNGNSQQLVLKGNNYQPGAIVRLQNRDMRVVALSPTEITIQVPENFPRPSPNEESWVLEVENPDTQNYLYRIAPVFLLPPASSTSSCASCPAAPTPELISAAPQEIVTSEEDYTITVTGKNMPPSASFRVESAIGGGVAYPAVVESISPDRAVLRLPGASRKVCPQRIVMNAGRTASSTGFNIVPGRRPVITSLSVPSTTATGQAFTTLVNGSNFFTTPPAVLTGDNGRILKSRILSDNQAVVEIPADMNAPGAPIPLRLTNADNQFAEAPLAINGADPLTIRSVQPTRFTETTIEYLVRGTGFYPSSRVSINDRPVRVRMVQSTEMVVEYPRSAPAPTRPGESTALRIQNTDGQCASYCMDATLFTPPSSPGIGIGNNSMNGKTGSESHSSSSANDFTTSESIGNLSVFPNPTDENITVQFSVEKAGAVSFSVKDMLGRLVLAPSEETFQSGAASKSLSLGTLPQGVYFVELQQQSRRTVMKVVKQR